MTDSQKLAAYDKYINAVTEGTKVGLAHPQVMDADFLNFIESWEEKSYDDVDVSHLGGLSYARLAFYKSLFSTTFHTAYSSTFYPAAYGPSNNLLVQIERDNNDYTIIYNGLTESTQRIVMNNPTITQNNSRSIIFTEGVVSALFKLLTKTLNGAPVWNYQLAVNGRLVINYYMVPWKLAD